MLGLLGLAVAAVWTRSLTALLALLAITVFLAAASKLPVRLFMPAAGALLLALTVALPSVFLTPGEPVFKIPLAGTATLQEFEQRFSLSFAWPLRPHRRAC